GGMGEVYLAHDERLGRKVALKILPGEFVADPARVGRFEREARAVSALTHPNILTIYEVGEGEGLHFIAAEYVEGETLRARYTAARPSERDALRVAVQVAEALAAAHGAGIVHRDVKPENVMLRPDGYVKVLDFGLAKLAEREPGPDGDMTRTGDVMGTAAYMSPEQALGREVDHRADIFSFGALIYEVATGRSPFRGATAAATFDAILHRDPDPPSALNPELSAEFDHIVARALEKDPELRYQTASDMRAELLRLRRALESSPSAASASQSFPAARGSARPRSRLRAAGLALAALAAAAGLVALVRRPGAADAEPPAPPTHINFTQLTDEPGQELFPSLAPDGKSLVYSSPASGNWDVYVRRVGGRNTLNLTADSPGDDTQAAFSPDGELIAFRSERDGGGIFVMGATGESVRRLTDFGYYPAWSPDGRELAFSTHDIPDPSNRRPDASAVWVVNVSTGARRQVTSEEAGDASHPSWSPAGARIAYWGKHRGGQRDLWTVAASGGEPAQLTDDAAFDWGPVWSPDGRHVYFSSDRGGSMNLWRVPVEERTGRALGPPEPVTAPSPYAEHLSFSRDGRRAAYVSRVSSTNVMKVAFDPRREAPAGPPAAVTRGSKQARAPDPSPDGQWVAYSSQGEKQEDIYVVDRDGAGAPRQLTNDAHKDRDPRWSPDGGAIVFYSDRGGRYEAWAIRPDGSGLRRMTYTEGASVSYPSWSPDGARLVYNRISESPTVIEAARPSNEQTPRRLPLISAEPLNFFWATAWSPGGGQLVGWAPQPSPASGVYTYDFATNRYERLTEFGSYPRWLGDGRRLLLMTESKLFILSLESRKPREVLDLSPHRLLSYALSKDDRTIFYGLATTEADVWLLTQE
ncbi:MAG TPA: protein kinase, partial [Pyrinomonadaceae bacterium]